LIAKYAGIEKLVVVNTCCVTREAELKSLRRFRSARRKYPDHTIIATGCACRLTPEKYKTADKVIDNIERNELIHDIFPEPDRSRYFLKIQDGCNGECSFCIVAKMRDRLYSKPIALVKKEIEWAIRHGYKEIVFVGANIGLYGFESGEKLTDLLNSIKTIRSLPRIRLSSLEPRFINEELINRLLDMPFCRHFHIPIQSGDDRVLNLMKRLYDRKYLEKMVRLIARNFADCALGADVIVGFPNEKEKEFQDTYRFIQNEPFTHLHVFPYSARPLTTAYSLGDPVERSVKKQRLWELKGLIRKKNYLFRKSLVDKIFNIVMENSGTLSTGLTDNYTRITVDRKTRAKAMNIRVTRVSEEKTYGAVL
jgi:threonylcarbamoyladenosine tRNA methylthiotransferase MtaB